MRVLITGGYGFLGAWVVRRLLARQARVWIYDLKEDPRRLRVIMPEEQVRQVGFLEGDVTDLSNLRKVIGEHGVTHVLHLAGLQVPTCRADPILGAKVNVVGTLAVFEAVKAFQPQVERLVYASSAAVFGPMTDYPEAKSPLADDVKLTPSSHYGYFKCCNEGNARIYFQDHGISSIGLRPWTVYGVGRDLGMTSEPTKAIKCLALGRPYHITYGGVQDMQYVDDVAAVVERSLTAPYQGAKAYNLRGDVVSLAELHRAMCDVEPSAAQLITFGTRQIGIAYDLSDDALQRDLGPIPKTSLRDGIRQTLDLFRQLAAQGRLDTSDLDS
ncbi:MAG: NAD(P)-dependent oxidoreductase [Gemmataceae bacterium]